MVLQNLQTDFKGSNWKHEIDVRDFIQANYEPYDGDESFLAAPSARTTKLWDQLSEMFKIEREKGVYDAETSLPQTLDTYGAGSAASSDASACSAARISPVPCW